MAAHGQSLFHFRDSVNGFSIGIPSGWTYKVATELPSIKLMAWSPDSSGKIRENINVNIVDDAVAGIDDAKDKLLNAIEVASEFQLIDSGRTVNSGQQVFWLNEYHKTPKSNNPVFSTVFLVCDSGKAYIYTATSDRTLEVKTKPLFQYIGKTFKTGIASRREFVKVAFPEIKSWQKAYEASDSSTYMIQWLPVNETAANWKIMVYQSAIKDQAVESIHKAVQTFAEASRKESALTKVTILKEVNQSNQKWALFKAEAPGFPNDPHPESQLFYLVQGKKAFHVLFVAVKEKELSAAFVSKWTAIFRNSQLMYD
ncbi:hypothetical protein [Chitinophaga pinensis]|uniref:DUF1795 domain-containing protein n=1 Tax=Chitinophaga pinensis (strain ATCC 43595 / DSM 2588 / LMG 13176 / NBRC 15968 / NCIMB 11800 / UQM 2034) TaxID=485918 RepID=A0A979G9Z8_CHIPD|nr:hypothetical protein [Chitinophaga pinensis]ACU63437.1 hypothetical protein Cpin_6023 [Chitinophaga pinensis DSM 2588]